MREIKFRAWDKALNNGDGEPKMCPVWAICFADNYKSIRSIAVQEGKTIGSVRYRDFHNDLMKEDNFILMQFTGLKDKNGKEIYEGDIVKTPLFGQTIGSITFNSGKFILLFSRLCSPSTEIWGDLSSITMEVLGNIYENPELLEPPLGNNAEPIRNISEDDWRKDER